MTRNLFNTLVIPTSRRHPARARGGFTLMEVLVATGIFAVGMVAVAAIFPVAILLQKRTVQEINGKAFVDNAVAQIEVRGFSEAVLNADTLAADYPLATAQVSPAVPDLLVWPVPEAVTGTNGADYEWAAVDRSFGVNSSAADREVWWVPLFLDREPDPALTPAGRLWTVFIFVLQRDYDATYAKTAVTPGNQEWAIGSDAPQPDPDFVPGVARIGITFAGDRFNFTNTVSGDRIVRVGETVLAEDGTTYKVRESDATGIRVDGIVINSPTNLWVAHPGDSGQSSFVDLIRIDNTADKSLNNLIR